MRTHFPFILLLSAGMALALSILLSTRPSDVAAEAMTVDTSTPVTATEPISAPIRYEPRGALIPLAHIGGEIGALALDGGYAFVGQGSTVDVYRTSDGALTPIGRSQPLSTAVVQLELATVDGQRLAVARLSGGGLAFLDLSDPRAPVVLSTLPLPNWGTRFTLGPRPEGQGLGYIYITVESGFWAVDARDPTHPLSVGKVFDNYRTQDMAVVGATAYLLSADSGYSFGRVTVVDLADPIQPIKRGSLSLYDMRYETVLTAFERDGRRYVYTDAFVFDVTDPDAPKRLRSIEGAGYAPRWRIDGSHAFAIIWSQLVAYDIADPAWPRLAASYPFVGPTTFAPQNDLALVGTSYGDVYMLDLTALMVGRLVASAGPGHGSYTDIVLQEGRALVINPGSLEIYDAGDPANISKLGAARSEHPQRLAVDAHYAYAALGDKGLDIIDIANPRSPRVVSHLPIQTRDVALLGHYAYLAAGNGFLILDVSGPVQPIVMADPLGDPAQAVVVQPAAADGAERILAYVAAGDRLAIFDVTDPAAPSTVASFAAAGAIADLDMVDGAVYLGTGAFLQVVDVRAPGSPRELGRLALPVGIGRLQVNGTPGRRRVLLTGTALAVVDVTDPARPAWLGAFPAHNAPGGLDARGQRVYVANAGGFDIIDLADPPNGPQRRSVLPTLARADGVAASEGRLYINNGGRQLIVEDISRGPMPVLLSRLAAPDAFWTFAANGGWVYLALGYQRTVMAFDVTDPNSLVMRNWAGWDASALVVQTWRGRRYLAVQEKRCTHPWDSHWSAVEISDIGDGNPVGVRRYYIHECAGTMAPAVAGDGLYAMLSSGLNVFDMNAATLEPQAVLPWCIAWLVGAGDRLIAGRDGGWMVYDAADPTAPVLLATHLTDAWSSRPEFTDGLAWVLDKGVVRVFDVSNFDRPAEVARYRVPGGAAGLAVSGHSAYVAGAAAGLWVLGYRPGAQWLPLVGR